MAIDPSIVLQQRQQPNLLAEYAQAQNIAEGKFKRDLQQRALERSNKLTDLLSQPYETPEARESALLQGGFIDESSKLGKDRRENRKVDSEIGEKEFKTAHAKAQAFLDLASSAVDQNSYQSAIQTAKSMGIDVSNAPAQYDPAFVKAFGQQALTAQQRIENEARKRGLDIQALTQAESARHNRESEGTAAGNLKVSQDRLAFDKGESAVGGKPPAGYRWNKDKTSLEPIPGGPADKLGEGAQKQVAGIDSLSAAIDEYKQELKNWSNAGLVSPDARAAMGTKYNNMMLQAKEAYNLGVLNGPDYSILTQVVTNPMTVKGAITSNEALGAQATELDRVMQRTRKAVTSKGKNTGVKQRSVVRTGTSNGRKVVQYDDGTIEYAD